MNRVTVFMPVYNAEKYLRQSIDSILNQTFQNFDFIIVEDASSDHSMEILRSYNDKRIKVYQNERNMGISYTRNKGLELCKTEYMALLDDDDIAMPYRIEHEVEYLDEHPEIDVIGGHQRQIDANGKDLNKQWSVYLNPKYIKACLMTGNTMVNGSTMFRKKLIDENHIRYQDHCFGAEDYRFWVECSIKGTLANLDEVLLLWRNGHGNETSRSSRYNLKERKEFIDGIHTYALKENGFNLNDNQLGIINKAFMEEGTIDSEVELKRLYEALRTIADQANKLQLDNTSEIITMCRKRFGEKVGKAFYLWE
ncbi:MAG: glycosyltransferase family A protein [Anaerocolumna sp.]